MRAGAMKYRLKIFKPQQQTSGFGDEAEPFVSVGVIWAERVKFTGSRSIEVSEQFANYYAEFNIRDAHKIKSGFRVEEVCGHLYDVTNVIPNKDRGMSTLQCVRVNE